jgi:YbbR domain-containing protein
MVELPPGLRAVDIQPESVEFRLEERRSKVVPIHPKIVGEVPDGYRVAEVAVAPREITITGPEQSLAQLTHVQTEPINITGRTESFSTEVTLRLDDPLVEYRLGKPAVVSAEIVTQQVERVYSGIEVEAVNANMARVASIEPKAVSISLRGPKSIMDSMNPGQLLASVDLAGEEPTGARTVEREVQIRNIPAGVELVSKQPRFFRIYLAPRQAEIAGE